VSNGILQFKQCRKNSNPYAISQATPRLKLNNQLLQYHETQIYILPEALNLLCTANSWIRSAWMTPLNKLLPPQFILQLKLRTFMKFWLRIP